MSVIFDYELEGESVDFGYLNCCGGRLVCRDYLYYYCCYLERGVEIEIESELPRMTYCHSFDKLIDSPLHYCCYDNLP